MRREARAAVFCKPEDSVLSSEAGLFEAAPYHCPHGALQTHSPGRLALWVGHRRLQGQGGQELASEHRAVAMGKPLSLEPCVPALPAPPWAAASQREGWVLRSQATAQWTLGAPWPARQRALAAPWHLRTGSQTKQGFLTLDSQTPMHGIGLAGSTVPRVS